MAEVGHVFENKGTLVVMLNVIGIGTKVVLVL